MSMRLGDHLIRRLAFAVFALWTLPPAAMAQSAPSHPSDGVYGEVRKGWAVGEHGGGEMWLQNSNWVVPRLRAQRHGLALSLGADGMLVSLGG